MQTLQRQVVEHDARTTGCQKCGAGRGIAIEAQVAAAGARVIIAARATDAVTKGGSDLSKS